MARLAEYATRDALMAAAADFLAASLQRALEDRGAGCVALSGGSTPGPAYALLASRDLDWSRVRFALVDERFAPPTHDASNERLLRAALAPALAKGAQMLPLYTPAANAQAAADAAEALYGPLHIDAALMGMGEDGHTASWFAEAANLDALLNPQNPRAVAAVHAPSAAGAADRLTMTLSALARVAQIGLLITGAAKRALLDEVSSPAARAPASALFRAPLPAPLVLWAA